MNKIIISRTDNLGDVILTLPLAGILKSHFKNLKISFIGKSYTRPLIETCSYIDEFLDREEVVNNPEKLKSQNADAIVFVFPDKEIAKSAYKAGIKKRVGTSHRWYHWLYANKRVSFSRKKSNLHEAQLNMKLLKPLGIEEILPLEKFPKYYGFNKITPLNKSLLDLIDPIKFNLIIHPKSKGSAREWPLKYYYDLAKQLSNQNYHIYITGTEAEGKLIQTQSPELFKLSNITNLTGKLSLEELISFMAKCNGLLACSTGPLHIASALGINALGIYPPMKPIHPGRWAPLGEKATYLALSKDCNDCKVSQDCHCIKSINVNEVYHNIINWNSR